MPYVVYVFHLILFCGKRQDIKKKNKKKKNKKWNEYVADSVNLIQCANEYSVWTSAITQRVQVRVMFQARDKQTIIFGTHDTWYSLLFNDAQTIWMCVCVCAPLNLQTKQLNFASLNCCTIYTCEKRNNNFEKCQLYRKYGRVFSNPFTVTVCHIWHKLKMTEFLTNHHIFKNTKCSWICNAHSSIHYYSELSQWRRNILFAWD